MRSVRRLGLLAALVGAALLPTCTGASADVFGPISLASETPAEQVDYAHDSAISADGRFVVFDGSFGGVTGVWRRDLQSGAIEQVAGGDAELPSVSADGRFVSFTTSARLTPGDRNEGPDVYVRDMDVGSAQPCAAESEAPCSFTLASAVDGSEEALTYAASSEARKYGSLASGRTAISSNGREVAFVTTAVSDLLGPRPPQAPTTPAMQVAVRDLDTQTTQLVSAVAGSGDTQPVSSQEAAKTIGAVYAPGQQPPVFRPIAAYGALAQFGASISADGSTVAWLGLNVGEQAATLADENLPASYAEPLWRRIADGPSASTQRISGGADPLNPACIASGETQLAGSPSLADPCQGPFVTTSENGSSGTWKGGVGDVVPQLSSDGYAVAFLANAPLVALGANFGRTENHSDAYLADMHPGLTRVQSLRPLTELASGQSSDLATNAPIVDLAISADGTQIAFTTKRTVFPLGVPAYVSAPAAVPGMVELFDADLSDATLTRVTHGFEGGASERPHEATPPGEDPYLIPADGALSPSFTGNGDTLAFSSTADNLVYGDGNTPPLGHESEVFDGSDAFVVSRVLFESSPPQQAISPPPTPPAAALMWRLGATARSRKDGSVVVYVQVPGSGRLASVARAQILVRAKARSGSHRGRSRARLAARAVASRGLSSAGARLISFVLKPAARYASLVRRPGGLEATVSLSFAASGHPTLHDTLAVTFARHTHRHAAKRRVRR